MTAVIVFDFETTGTRPGFHDPIQFAAIALEQGTLKEIGTFSATMRPLRPENADPKAMQIHGLSMSDLIKAPCPARTAGEFAEWLRQWYRPIPCAYNLDFDAAFMKVWCPDVEWNYAKCDVLHVARALLLFTKAVDNAKLSTVTKYLGIEHRAHDALGDVRATADVLRRLRYGQVGTMAPLFDATPAKQDFVAANGGAGC